MEREQQLAERYPDLLDERSDPRLMQLVGDLDAVYGTGQPPAHLAPAIAQTFHERAAAHSPRPPFPLPLWRRGHGRGPARWLPRRAATVAAALVLAAVVLAGSAYALVPLLNSVFNMEPGTQQLIELNLAQRVHISRPLGGFMVTVERVYADSNRVVIGYTVATPPGHGYSVDLVDPVLTTQDGTALPGGSGMGSGNVGNMEGNVLFFDASGITGNPTSLSLHLVAQGLGGNEFAGSPNVRPFQVSGRLAFDFTVTFHPGRIAEPHQSVTVGGQTVTLERVVVTVSQTRVYLRGIDPTWVIGTLSVNGWTSDPFRNPQGGPIGASATPDGLTVISYGDALYDKHGEWTLVVSYANNNQAPKGGPWTFHFVVP
jgi:hypothetical protein